MEMLINKIVYPGRSMTNLDGKVIFTDEGLPGELVKVRIIKESRNFSTAQTLSIVKPSPHRIEPRCEHYKICSAYQPISYPLQLDIKNAQIKEIFLKELGIQVKENLIMPSPVQWGYRNKAHLKVLWNNNQPHLAYNLPDSADKYVEIGKCFLFSDAVNSSLEAFLNKIKAEKAYSVKEALIRESDVEELEGKTLCFGAKSFFQVNIPMLKEALKDIKNDLALSGRETLADLYCGVGTFGIILAPLAKKVLGVDSSPENIYFLKKNLELNGINNFIFYEGLSENLIGKVLKEKPDVLILDPPRRGLDKKMCEEILKSQPPSVLYISCNPSTLARDLKILLGKYKIKKMRAWDFFPQTPHIEMMCLMSCLP